MMQLHLDQISRNVAAAAHPVLLLDKAGWHTTSKLDVPDNITPIFLPSRAPELNPVENVWQYLRQNWLSNTVFENYDAIVDAACATWRTPHRSTQNDHVHRNARPGSRRSAAMTLGIRPGLSMPKRLTSPRKPLLSMKGSFGARAMQRDAKATASS
jgi:transposase